MIVWNEIAGATKEEALAYHNTRKNAFNFVRELCNMARVTNHPVRERFIRSLCDHDILAAIEEALVSAPVSRQLWLWLVAVDVVMTILINDPSILRAFIVKRLSSHMSLYDAFLRVLTTQDVRAYLLTC